MPIVMAPQPKKPTPAKKPEPPPILDDPFPGENERRRKQLIERLILSATLAFCGIVVFAVWYSEGKVLESPTKFLAQFAGKDAQSPRDYAQNCQHPKNRNTPYCQERTAQVNADWQSMGRTQGGKTNPFSLHNR